MKKIVYITTISLLAFTGYRSNPNIYLNKDIDNFQEVVNSCLYELELKSISDSLNIEVKNSSEIVKNRINNIRNDSVKKELKIKFQTNKINSLNTENRTLKKENIKLNKEIEKLVKYDKIEPIEVKGTKETPKRRGIVKAVKGLFTKKDKK